MAEAQIKWPALKVRNTFLKYFEDLDHTLGRSFFNLSVWWSTSLCRAIGAERSFMEGQKVDAPPA